MNMIETFFHSQVFLKRLFLTFRKLQHLELRGCKGIVRMRHYKEYIPPEVEVNIDCCAGTEDVFRVMRGLMGRSFTLQVDTSDQSLLDRVEFARKRFSNVVHS